MEKFVVSVEIDACFHLQLCEYASKFPRLLPPHQSRGITAKPTLIQNIFELVQKYVLLDCYTNPGQAELMEKIAFIFDFVNMLQRFANC